LEFLRAGEWECPPHLDQAKLRQEGLFYGVLKSDSLFKQVRSLSLECGFGDKDIREVIEAKRAALELNTQKDATVIYQQYKEQNKTTLVRITDILRGKLAEQLNQDVLDFHTLSITFFPSILPQQLHKWQEQGYPILKCEELKCKNGINQTIGLPLSSQTVFDDETCNMFTQNQFLRAFHEELSAHSLTMDFNLFHLSLENPRLGWTNRKNHSPLTSVKFAPRASIDGYTMVWNPKDGNCVE
jgi:hypothetical protein